MPEELIDFNQAFEELANSISASKTAIKITTFENFIQEVFSLSYPEYSFETWHVHSIGKFLDDVLASENKMSVSVLPRYHMKCLATSTNVLLKNGFQKQIKDLAIGEDVMAYDDFGHLIDAKVKAIYFCRQTAKKIKLQSGKEIIASDNHRFYCNLRWKPVSDIKVGDLMAEPMNIKVVIANKLTYSDAVLLGYFYSEGDKNIKYGIHITNESKNAFEDLTLIAKEHNWHLRKDAKCHYAFSKITGKRGKQKDSPIHYLKDHLGVKSKEYLTEELFKASDEMVSIFLQRFWLGDGTINAKTCQMSVTQKSEQLCKDIQVLLLRFGIVSSISSTLCKTQKGMERYYCVSISSKDSIDKFADKIGFIKEHHLKQHEELNKKRNFEKSDYIPAIWRDCIKNKRSVLLNKVGADSDYSYSTPRYKLEKACALVENKELSKITTSDVCWKRVISIEAVGEQELVDIQLTPEGAFIGDGIICHNSTLLGYAFSIYRMLTAFGDGLYISYKDELANFHLSNIKNAISRNPILNPIMHDLRPQSSAGIEYKIGNKRVRMFSSGIFAMKRGLHTDLCTIVDDVLGTVENPLSMLELDKAKLMFNTEVQNIPNRDCPLIVFGTVMSYSDLLFDLKDNDEFMHLWYSAINPDAEHEVLWEDKYPMSWLEKKKKQSGWKSFSTEFLLMPVMATEAFFTKEELDIVINKNLKNYSIYRPYDKEYHHIVAGLDIGKRRNPSHLAIFVDNDDGKLIQLHQEFWDGMEYIEQIEKIKAAVENFKIDKLYIDATRGEMEERGLPRECVMVKFTGRGFRSQSSYATDFAKYVENKKIELIDDTRFINQILCLTNDLRAPESSLGHADCYDTETEVLTDKGWKLFKDLDKTERIATLNHDGCLEWQLPTDYIIKYYKGKMYQVKSTQIDLLVTPLHKMFVNGKLRQPEEIFNKQVTYQKDAKWNGEEQEFFIMPSSKGVRYSREEVKIPMDTWLEFIGYYIAEGHCTKRTQNRYQLCISQKSGEKREKMKACISKLPFNTWENEDGIWFANFQFGEFLYKLGKSTNKYIPEELLNLSTRQLNILYRALMDGDGTYNKTFKQYYTSSIKLAGQFQELLLKIGKSGNIYIRDFIGRKAPHGTTRNLCYAVAVIEHKNKPMVNKQKAKGKLADSWVDYNDIIYCVTVPNHVMYIRRNGKPCWSGNSFWSVSLAVGAYQDYFAPDRVKGFSYLGDAQETLEVKKGVALSKNRNDICKMCNKRTVNVLEDGSLHCDSCFTTYSVLPVR